MKESTYLNRWLWEKHKTHVQWRRIRVGPLPSKAMARMYMSLLRWVDAIFLQEGMVHIVEAKIAPRAGAIGQLLLYKELFLQTPEFQAYKSWPIVLDFLCPEPDLQLAETCTKHGIRYIVWKPKDFDDDKDKPK